MHDGHEHAGTHIHGDDAEARALAEYMLAHNRHHAEELHNLAHTLEHGNESAAKLLHEATALFAQGNDKLEAALALWKKEA